ncbi:MAG: ATP-binding protein [Chloroflexi bacterium]|nr:ATP-binding protein [Chloroflexota bacterium]
MGPFVGREEHLKRLSEHLTAVRESGAGRLLSIRGRRRVGKSRLIEEWLQREGAPHVFFAASRQPPERELALFAQEVVHAGAAGAAGAAAAAGEPGASSGLAGLGGAAAGVRFDSWEAALTYLATLATAARAAAGVAGDQPPLVIVLDEFPYLLEGNPALEATLQKVWDRVLQRAPVLLVLVGSDISMMAALTEYGRPLYGRARELVLPPFSPLETATMLDLDGAAAFDAYLVAGGFPLVVQSWRRGQSRWQFLARELADPTSPLIVTGERMLSAEFPREVQARDVLGVIGAGETTFSTIGRAAGITQASLNRALDVLVRRKRVVAAYQPLSSRPSRETRYCVADPYLRFWLRFVAPGMEEIERGRSDLVVERIHAAWETYRGRAIEPLVREAIERLLPDPRFGEARYVGGYWTRTNDVEVDLVGARERVAPRRVAFVGSIKWKERAPFDRQDVGALLADCDRVPGTDEKTLRVAVSRAGHAEPSAGAAGGASVDVALTPSDLLLAWQERRRSLHQVQNAQPALSAVEG